MKQRTFLAVIFMAAFLFLAAGISQLAVTELRPDGFRNGPQRRLALSADLRHLLV